MSTEGLRESSVGKIKGFVAGIYSPSGVMAMREAQGTGEAGCSQCENLYPFISPAALL